MGYTDKFLTQLSVKFQSFYPEYKNTEVTAEPTHSVKQGRFDHMLIEIKAGGEVVAHYYHFYPDWKQLEQPVLNEDEYKSFSKIYYKGFKLKETIKN